MEKVEQNKQRLLAFLRQRIGQGIPPSVREICTEMGFKSTCTAHKYLKMLETEGQVEILRGSNRGIRLRDFGTSQVPLVGTVAAGTPILAQQNVEGYIVTDDLHTTEGVFALRVKGESMINAGILDGDIILVRQTPAAENGEIVVALIEDEATVKTFYVERDGRVRLQPENDSMSPIYPETVAILGKVVRLIRDF
ncbi:transcriptional repressor LexA [Neobittarella massiliensis]|uniref:LexA repressor n=2 Tax=Oscillospiraceae TaxID=216572 RepID=A0A8J6M036_9FIRM|nr:transcriptional repressor LexA [Neobittarella massiliensis]MBC3517323.1 transcriptional repressor LexA [Neobittarella massiliensis]SCJ91517.1 LexA repressor [uncultured Anaerotruncus sp.]